MSGCSLALDFSDQAIPIDAALDAPFAEAECAYGEPNDTAAMASPLAPADRGPAAICSVDDRDFYRITVPELTAQVELRIGFTHSETGDLDLRLTRKTGETLAQSVGFSDGEAIVCPGTAPPCAMLAADDYVLEVFPGPDATNRYTIEVVVTPVTAR
ncbi:MAG: PPC domain-containing protein [Myxococcales bacterium]|nr:PPC domain-containing protein [Myxococcales bacterium]